MCVIGPGDIAQAHTTDEWIELDQLRLGTGLYARMIEQWCIKGTAPMAESPAAPDSHDPYLAFRNPIYRRFALSYVLAVISSQILATAVQWDVYALTRVAARVRLARRTERDFPLMLLSLPAGHVVDIMPRRRILIITQVLLIAIPVDDGRARRLRARQPVADDPALRALGLNAITLTFARPARVSLLPSIIPRELYGNAFTWNSSLFEMSSWVGPALTGPAPSRRSEVGLFQLRTVHGGLHGADARPSQPAAVRVVSSGDVRSTACGGLRFVWSTPLLISAMTLDMLAVLLGGATYLLPVFTKNVIEAPATTGLLASESTLYGLLRAAPAFGARDDGRDSGPSAADAKRRSKASVGRRRFRGAQRSCSACRRTSGSACRC